MIQANKQIFKYQDIAFSRCRNHMNFILWWKNTSTSLVVKVWKYKVTDK